MIEKENRQKVEELLKKEGFSCSQDVDVWDNHWHGGENSKVDIIFNNNELIFHKRDFLKTFKHPLITLYSEEITVDTVYYWINFYNNINSN